MNAPYQETFLFPYNQACLWPRFNWFWIDKYYMYCYIHTAVFHFKTWQYSLALTSVLCEDGGLAGGGGQLNHYLGVIYLAV